MSNKPLGGKSYGSIPHLPGSRLGSGDHHCHQGQADICLVKKRDRHDRVMVQEKLDGSNVAVARVGGELLAITRAGYLANTSPYPQHHFFHEWVNKNRHRFLWLNEGERVAGEWLIQAHGTRYVLNHDPFVPFDILRGKMERAVWSEVHERAGAEFVLPSTIAMNDGDALSLEFADVFFGQFGHHGALDPIEGFMYRVERQGKVDFLAKYVKHFKQDGKYLPEMNGGEVHWNTFPGCELLMPSKISHDILTA